MPAHEALQMAFTALSQEYPGIREQVGVLSFVTVLE
jgi:F420-0:gamma-glutamyl ligase-like protein